MLETPLISVIIPTYNRAGYLEQAIRSVLEQDYPRLEVVVADNASEDGTSDVVRAFSHDGRVRYVRRPENIGMVRNWHQALTEDIGGDWFVILSDDDYFTDSGYLSKAAELIRRHPSLVIVYANGVILDEASGGRTPMSLPFQGKVDGKAIFLMRGRVKPQYFTLCNILFRRDLAMALHPFENPWNLSCDSELFLKMLLHGDAGVIQDLVSVYRWTGSNNLIQTTVKPDFMIHGNDQLLNPYLHALAMDAFPELVLRKWRRRLIDRSLRKTLAALKKLAPAEVPRFLEYVYQKSPRLFWTVARHHPIRFGVSALSWRARADKSGLGARGADSRK